MPAGNGMGPMGRGPLTGRGAGYCVGFGAPGYANPGPGRGFGFGRGRGGGWGRGLGFRGGWNPGSGSAPWYPGVPTAPGAAPTREQQLETLKAQAEYFEGALGELRKRMQDIAEDPSE